MGTTDKQHEGFLHFFLYIIVVFGVKAWSLITEQNEVGQTWDQVAHCV